jgi:hypothetical protein
MEYHFSAFKTTDHRVKVASSLFLVVLLITSGVWYFVWPRYASIEVGQAVIQAQPGSLNRLNVKVTNLSREVYSAESRVLLSGRFVGSAVVLPPLPRVDLGQLAPDQYAEYRLEFVAPTQPGRYRLQVDLVREGVSWFANLGNPAPSVEVLVP